MLRVPQAGARYRRHTAMGLCNDLKIPLPKRRETDLSARQRLECSPQLAVLDVRLRPDVYERHLVLFAEAPKNQGLQQSDRHNGRHTPCSQTQTQTHRAAAVCQHVSIARQEQRKDPAPHTPSLTVPPRGPTGSRVTPWGPGSRLLVF